MTKMCKVTTSLPLPKKAASAAKKTNRRVTFGRVSGKIFHQSLTKSQKQAMWYQSSDYKRMNKDVRASLKKELFYGFDPNDTERTWRGLEHIREGVPNIKLQRRQQFVRSFLHVYKTMGIQKPEELGEMIAAESKVDRDRALHFAEYDAYEAACVYRQEEPCQVHYQYGRNHWHEHQYQQKQQIETDAVDYYKEFNVPRSACTRPIHTIIVPRAC